MYHCLSRSTTAVNSLRTAPPAPAILRCRLWQRLRELGPIERCPIDRPAPGGGAEKLVEAGAAAASQIQKIAWPMPAVVRVGKLTEPRIAHPSSFEAFRQGNVAVIGAIQSLGLRKFGSCSMWMNFWV